MKSGQIRGGGNRNGAFVRTLVEWWFLRRRECRAQDKTEDVRGRRLAIEQLTLTAVKRATKKFGELHVNVGINAADVVARQVFMRVKNVPLGKSLGGKRPTITETNEKAIVKIDYSGPEL